MIGFCQAAPFFMPADYGAELDRDFVGEFGQPASLWLPIDGEKKAYDFSGNGSHGTLKGGITTTGDGVGVLGQSWKFDGTSGYGAIPVDLSATSKLTIAFAAEYSAASAVILLEFSSDYNNVNTGFLLSQGGAPGSTFELGVHSASGYTTASFPAPSVGVMHHYVVTMDKTQTAANTFKAWVDGVPQTITGVLTSNPSGTFGKDTLYLASRGGSSLFNNCSLSGLMILPDAISGAKASALYSSLLYGEPYRLFDQTVNERFIGNVAATSGLLLARRRAAA